MYIRGGYNVYPAEVERVLSEHPARRAGRGARRAAIRCSARSASRSSWPRRARRRELAELRTFCKAALADYKAPDRLVVVDALPVTSVGKVDKRALAEDAAPGRVVSFL